MDQSQTRTTKRSSKGSSNAKHRHRPKTSERPSTPSIHLLDNSGCHNNLASVPAAAASASSSVANDQPITSDATLFSNTCVTDGAEEEKEEDGEDEEGDGENAIEVRPLPKIRLDLMPSPREEDEDEEDDEEDGKDKKKKKKKNRRHRSASSRKHRHTDNISKGRSSGDDGKGRGQSTDSQSKRRSHDGALVGASSHKSPQIRSGTTTSITETMDTTAEALNFSLTSTAVTTPTRNLSPSSLKAGTRDVHDAAFVHALDADGFPVTQTSGDRITSGISPCAGASDRDIRLTNDALAHISEVNDSFGEAFYEGEAFGETHLVEDRDGVVGTASSGRGKSSIHYNEEESSSVESIPLHEEVFKREADGYGRASFIAAASERGCSSPTRSIKSSETTKTSPSSYYEDSTVGTEMVKRSEEGRLRRNRTFSDSEKRSKSEEKRSEKEEKAGLSGPFDWLLSMCGDLSSVLADGIEEAECGPPHSSQKDAGDLDGGHNHRSRQKSPRRRTPNARTYDMDNFNW